MIFLDVGAHTGQTLQEVLLPRYPFEEIYAFEPMPVQFAKLVEKFTDPRLHLVNCGLADGTQKMPMYGANDHLEASIYPTKIDVDNNVVTECEFIKASVFFREKIGDSDRVIMKLNCEGSEIPILNDLIESKEIWKLENVMIDFDVRKVVGMESLEYEMLDRLQSIGFDRYSLSDEVMTGTTHQGSIRNWLAGVL